MEKDIQTNFYRHPIWIDNLGDKYFRKNSIETANNGIMNNTITFNTIFQQTFIIVGSFCVGRLQRSENSSNSAPLLSWEIIIVASEIATHSLQSEIGKLKISEKRKSAGDSTIYRCICTRLPICRKYRVGRFLLAITKPFMWESVNPYSVVVVWFGSRFTMY